MPFFRGRTTPVRTRGVWGARFVAFLCLLQAGGQGSARDLSRPPLKDGAALLRWSMERMAALHTYRAVCDWTMSFGRGTADTRAVRYLALERPNRFKIVARLGDRQEMTCVCDGVRLVEYSNRHPKPVSYPAPPNPAAASSLQMGHPMFCGSMLYAFFEGPAALSRVVDLRRSKPALGPEVIVDGAVCRTVRFYATGTYGTTEVAIALKDGLVRRIRYNSEPLLALVKHDFKGRLPAVSQTTEVYRSVEGDVPIARSVFRLPERSPSVLAAKAHRRPSAAPRRFAEKAVAPDRASAPLGRAASSGRVPIPSPARVQALPAPASGPRFSSLVPPAASSRTAQPTEGEGAMPVRLPPPVWAPYASQPPRVPLGSPAPPFLLIGPDGSQVDLANLRGKVVVLTFWATWEPRCAEWLARLQHLAKQLDEPRLVILAVAHQPRRKAQEFARGHGISLPLYEDPGRAAGLAYRVPTVPTTVIVDGRGVLRAYIIGMPSQMQLRQELEKAGLYGEDPLP